MIEKNAQLGRQQKEQQENASLDSPNPISSEERHQQTSKRIDNLLSGKLTDPIHSPQQPDAGANEMESAF